METGDLCQLRVLGRGTESGFSECQTDVYSGSILPAAQVCRSFDEYQSGSHQPGLSGLQTLAQVAVKQDFHNSLYQFLCWVELQNSGGGDVAASKREMCYAHGETVFPRHNTQPPFAAVYTGHAVRQPVQRFSCVITTLCVAEHTSALSRTDDSTAPAQLIRKSFCEMSF